jgi:hypothetical protein
MVLTILLGDLKGVSIMVQKNYIVFHVDMYVSVIDRELSEFNGRFNEVKTKQLSCMAVMACR